ncbi:hypothetical protein N665_0632s0020 [Sinapis alba]|nr:hypothetical protein N665_0632s0020 [Sinapis alba]
MIHSFSQRFPFDLFQWDLVREECHFEKLVKQTSHFLSFDYFVGYSDSVLMLSGRERFQRICLLFSVLDLGFPRLTNMKIGKFA